MVLVVGGWVSPAAAQSNEDAGLGANPFALPGTQPGELSLDFRSPDVCLDCHGEYASYAANETWGGSMMANAARDPLFHAALAIANQDDPRSGDLCVRCHSPRAWLFGRSTPAELSNLEPDDYESVQCDFCHRLVVDESGSEPRIGNAQYTVADDYVRRGTLTDSVSRHDWELSEYHGQSELCGLCHDVSNPAQGGFAIERTYTEWQRSAYPSEGQTCQRCHMPEVEGFAAGARNLPTRRVHEHGFVGGNAWIPLVIASEHPELERGDQFAATAAAAEVMLSDAATLSIESPVATESELSFAVRVQNHTGHKLPTGYPEGRLCWLEVIVQDSRGRVVLHSGSYDSEAGQRAWDAQLRTYEVALAARGVEGFHFVLQNEVVEDTRIPPRGFRPTADTIPVGRSYENQGTEQDPVLAHWDTAPYTAQLSDAFEAPFVIRARMWYQTASRQYVEFLRDENRTDDAGERMFELWLEHGKSSPVLMAETELEVGSRHREGAEAGPDGAAGHDGGADQSPDGAVDASFHLDAAARHSNPSDASDASLDAATAEDATSSASVVTSRDGGGAGRPRTQSTGCGCASVGAGRGPVGVAWLALAGLFLSMFTLRTTTDLRR